MIKKVALFFLVLMGAIAIVAAMQPSSFHVERSATFDATAEKIFEHVNNLHKWDAWSPWAKIDPKAQLTFEGPEAGVGASMIWSSESNEVGKGRMTITESRAAELIKFRLDFTTPMQATNTAEFNFKQNANQTTVTWSMSGEKNFIMKVVGLFMDCDKMIGTPFEKGLNNLKAQIK